MGKLKIRLSQKFSLAPQPLGILGIIYCLLESEHSQKEPRSPLGPPEPWCHCRGWVVLLFIKGSSQIFFWKYMDHLDKNLKSSKEQENGQNPWLCLQGECGQGLKRFQWMKEKVARSFWWADKMQHKELGHSFLKTDEEKQGTLGNLTHDSLRHSSHTILPTFTCPIF